MSAPRNIAAVRLAARSATLWLAVTPFAGCLNVPETEAPMCHVDADCNHLSGEVCQEGVCWGNPPPGPYAGVLAPPSGRHDLVPQELPEVIIPDYGLIQGLVLEGPVSLTGRVVPFCFPPLTCEAMSVPATITVSRPSSFHGGPGFSTAVNVKAGDSFSIPVPRTKPGDPPYGVTVVPDGAVSLALQVPPLHLQLVAPRDTPIVTTLSGGSAMIGTLLDSSGQGLHDYRVTVLGRWEAGAAPTEVSSVNISDATGHYQVTLSDGLVGTLELIARPLGPIVGPTIHVANIDPGVERGVTRNVMLPAGLGAAVEVPIQVLGLDSGGALGPVVGAVVSVSGAVSNSSTGTSFTVSDERVTDNHGDVTLQVLDGSAIAGSYRLSITPPASSKLSVVFDQKLVLGSPPDRRLPPRIQLRGRVLDRAGKPVPNVSVTARPSLRFLWSLEAAAQTFVAAIPTQTAVTDTTSGDGAGVFVLWVDANVATVWGHYDLLIEPAMTARMPTFVKADVDVRAGMADTVGLGDITVPDTAYVHGRITGTKGDPVEGAELKLYVVSNAISLCTEVAHPPMSCPIPAALRGRNTSDSDGIVRLTLPR